MMVEIARVLVIEESGIGGGFEGFEPKIQPGPEEGPALKNEVSRFHLRLGDEYDCFYTCGKERRSVAISWGADLLVRLAHFPLLLPEKVPVLLQRLLLHSHHCDSDKILHKDRSMAFQSRRPRPWKSSPTSGHSCL